MISRILSFQRNTRHQQILIILIVAAGVAFHFVRIRLIPESFGQHGPYRGQALNEIKAKPSVLPSDKDCMRCHEDVGDEREEALHKVVGCWHCHGVGREHIALADAGEVTKDAAEWDGNFKTSLDLYITRDRKACLVCHEALVGIPEEFQTINVAEHLEENEAEEPKSRDVCFECHAGHDTAP